MIPRYQTQQMHTIWSDAERLRLWFKVELAATKALEMHSMSTQGVAAQIDEAARTLDWQKIAHRALEIEETTKHDLIAFLSALEEELGDVSRQLHVGMTSSDVVDTAFALQLMQATDQLHTRLAQLRASLWRQAHLHKRTVCLGRTHGQAAEVTTFGVKLLSYVAECDRALHRLQNARREIAVGQLSGAVGNYANIDPGVEKDAMKLLGLEPEQISTQVVPRDRHAVWFSTLAVVAGLLERLAVEIRHLMRTEVGEAFEPFGKGQRGSSAMPHKKNPILTENVTGLARLVRSYAQAALENQALWHERDISHSSVERVIAPDASSALDFAMARMVNVIDGLVVDSDRMRKHVDATEGLIFSEAVLLALVRKGVLRQEAYTWVQRAAMKAREGQDTFDRCLSSDADVTNVLNTADIQKLFDVQHHLRHVDAIFARVDGVA